MKLAHAFIVRDAMTKQALYDVFSDDERMIAAIDVAFSRVNEAWIQQLGVMFEENEVQSLLALTNYDSPDLSEMVSQVARRGLYYAD